VTHIINPHPCSAPSGVASFAAELAAYKGSKGSVHFPLDRPLPLELITRIVQFRLAENLAKAAAKKGQKSK
jgi:uncharacterized protein YdhG (YjbR/CyaY superfamily)